MTPTASAEGFRVTSPSESALITMEKNTSDAVHGLDGTEHPRQSPPSHVHIPVWVSARFVRHHSYVRLDGPDSNGYLNAANGGGRGRLQNFGLFISASHHGEPVSNQTNQ